MAWLLTSWAFGILDLGQSGLDVRCISASVCEGAVWNGQKKISTAAALVCALREDALVSQQQVQPTVDTSEPRLPPPPVH